MPASWWIRFDLTLWKLCQWFILKQPYVGCWRKKIFMQNIFPNHKTKAIFRYLLKINFLLETSFLEKFKWFLTMIFENCDYEGTKIFLNATEVMTYRNGIKAYHLKMLNGFISCSGHICEQLPLFFIIQAVLIKERHCFILRYYLATIFLSLIKAKVIIFVKLVKLRQNHFVNKRFSWRY